MAKKSKIEANNRRIRMVEQYRERRQELKRMIRDQSLSEDERSAARIKLQKLPKDSNPIRVRNRCNETGRPRGVYSKIMLSRIAFRSRALNGELPGVTKASW